jgi:methyl-accepting chemotaxis protein
MSEKNRNGTIMTDRPEGRPLLAILVGITIICLVLAGASLFLNGQFGAARQDQAGFLAKMELSIGVLSALNAYAEAGDQFSGARDELVKAHKELAGVVQSPFTSDAISRLAGDKTLVAKVQTAASRRLELATSASLSGAGSAVPEQQRVQIEGARQELDKALAQLSSRVDQATRTVSGPVAWWFSFWVPMALLGLALGLVVVAVIAYRADDSARAAAAGIAEQNARNQEAILKLLDELSSLADGDLTVQATVSEDITGAIADSINFAIEALRELVITIKDSAIMVDGSTKQTEATATHLARASEQQSHQIAAATESIAQMASSIEQVAGNAERSADVARHSVDVAHKGGDAVRRTIDGMNAIRETIQETSKRIKRLGESSQEIGNIVELINDIAEQTNILALNASIQASMAGEAGRGFAVVADEVQRLAERSANATKQIEVLVRTIQADTNEAVVSMERSTTDVVGGALLAENAGAALEEIEQVSNQIAALVQDISGTARHLKGASGDIASNMSVLQEISSQAAESSSATSNSISNLSSLASQLRTSVAGFRLPESVSKSGIFMKPSFASGEGSDDGGPGRSGKAS